MFWLFLSVASLLILAIVLIYGGYRFVRQLFILLKLATPREGEQQEDGD